MIDKLLPENKRANNLKEKLFLGIILLTGMLFYSYRTSDAAPSPRGRVYEITAKILLVKQESQKRFFDVQRNVYLISMPVDIEIREVTRMVTESQSPKGTEYRDKYSEGQKLSVNATINENDLLKDVDILKAGSLVKGNIYSAGDERGDWYDFDVGAKIEK